MTPANEKIDSYLRRVRAGLRTLSAADIEDILNELRAHITERLAENGTVDSVLGALGKPEQIAALYVAENLSLQAESSRSPWTVLRSVFHWATLSAKGFALFAVCLIGYSFGLSFFLAALLKPFHPEGVGLWTSGDHQAFSLHVGGFSGHPGEERELLGWWLIPVGCSLGGGTTLLTTYVALWGLRKLRRSKNLR